MSEMDAAGRSPGSGVAKRAVVDDPPRRAAVQTLQAAVEQMVTATRLGDLTMQDEADDRVRAAVDAARDAGVEWGQIGDALGIARGNAYQRYRRRAGEPD